jgi:F-type H+-transporting ATPase subunit b
MGQIGQILTGLGFGLHAFLLNVIAFVILFLVLKRFLFTPLSAMMKLRAQEIAEGLEASRQHKEALSLAETERERILAEAREQGRERVRQAVKEGDEARERLLAEARDEAQRIRDRGREAVDLEREQALLEVRRTVVDLALSAASRAVIQRLDEKQHRQAVEEFITGLERAQ